MKKPTSAPDPALAEEQVASFIAKFTPEMAALINSLRSTLEVFLVFLRLGCTSFGGPIAHLGYYQKEFITRRRWCSQETLAELIALAQSLPGPASSQVAFALGILRAGLPGGLAAFAGFTLPSALLMFAFAATHAALNGTLALALLHGLALVAVAVVAQAVLSMQRSLAPDLKRILIAAVAAAILLKFPGPFTTLAVIALAATIGQLLFRNHPHANAEILPIQIPRSIGLAAGILFSLLLAASLVPVSGLSAATLAAAFYRSGALVFGGGHVVLPLLESTVVAPGWLPQSTFLAGYGAAQALPGPVFALAAYLGSAIRPSPNPLLYGTIALLALFLPGLLAVTAVLPWWSRLRANPLIRAALHAVNASVVGILLAALIQPLCMATLHSPADVALALAALALLVFAKAPAWLVVPLIAAIALVASRF